jgi:hypothetical protein
VKHLAALGLLGLLQLAPQAAVREASPSIFLYQRSLTLPAGQSGQACAIVDAAMMEHTQGRVAPLRIYALNAASQGSDNRWRETPYVLTESGESGQAWEQAQVRNLGVTATTAESRTLAFDLAMPSRSYTAVTLDLRAQDFYATATVYGEDTHGARTKLGTYALFDLQGRGLSRDTTLPLQEEMFPVLHVELKLQAAPTGDLEALSPSIVEGASVPPSREAQALFTVAAATQRFSQQPRRSVAELSLPAYVPVARVRFALQPGFHGNFSRDVTITAAADPSALIPSTLIPSAAAASDAAVSAASISASRGGAADDAETLHGEIHHVAAASPQGTPLAAEALSFEALLGANLREPAHVMVAVENGDDAPLPLASVALEMRQRALCFDAARDTQYIARYGVPWKDGEASPHTDASPYPEAPPVRPPVYEYARLFHLAAHPAVVSVGAEVQNPEYTPAAAPLLPFTSRHPWLLWVALMAVIAVLGAVALRNAAFERRENH